MKYAVLPFFLFLTACGGPPREGYMSNNDAAMLAIAGSTLAIASMFNRKRLIKA